MVVFLNPVMLSTQKLNRLVLDHCHYGPGPREVQIRSNSHLPDFEATFEAVRAKNMNDATRQKNFEVPAFFNFEGKKLVCVVFLQIQKKNQARSQ